ncbi:hypothetical protein I7I53_08122 [Histoplasma capsulatum var. duboisii H88]|uniref:Uncharacterized protein n=1 Tax=Ajellomyces capsulatus (strain H88) TaxID=544711 RepID=A0A8A1LF14_AJEC8|nr:hypothetical protein I7I53_08122 [Histoplasma capsulatum var. duboisii H88]
MLASKFPSLIRFTDSLQAGEHFCATDRKKTEKNRRIPFPIYPFDLSPPCPPLIQPLAFW